MRREIWQIVVILVFTFLFGLRLGWVNGEAHAWQERDDQEDNGGE